MAFFPQHNIHNHLEWDILARLEDELLITVGQSLPHDDVRNSWLVHDLGHSNNFLTRHLNQQIWRLALSHNMLMLFIVVRVTAKKIFFFSFYEYLEVNFQYSPIRVIDETEIRVSPLLLFCPSVLPTAGLRSGQMKANKRASCEPVKPIRRQSCLRQIVTCCHYFQ